MAKRKIPNFPFIKSDRNLRFVQSLFQKFFRTYSPLINPTEKRSSYGPIQKSFSISIYMIRQKIELCGGRKFHKLLFGSIINRNPDFVPDIYCPVTRQLKALKIKDFSIFRSSRSIAVSIENSRNRLDKICPVKINKIFTFDVKFLIFNSIPKELNDKEEGCEPRSEIHSLLLCLQRPNFKS